MDIPLLHQLIPYRNMKFGNSAKWSLLSDPVTINFITYGSVPDKRPLALYHNSLVFTTLGAYPVYWALTVCKIMHKISGWSQHTIVVMVIRSRLPLASMLISCFSQGSYSLNIEASYTKLVMIQLLVADRVDA